VKRIRLLALLAAAALLLSGCTAMLERSYSSSAAHMDYAPAEDSSILRAESYQVLVNSMLYFVGEHVGSGTIRLHNYTGNPEADLAKARGEIMEETPLGAYAVQDIRYEITRILTYYEVKLHFAYRRTAAEVTAIRSVSGQAGLRKELDRITGSHLALTTLQTSYYGGDAQDVTDLFWLSYYSNPAMVMETPEISAVFYPEEGTQRILELQVRWSPEDAQQPDYALSLSTAAALLTQTAPPAGAQYTVEELAALLCGVVSYDPSGSQRALDALNGGAVNDLGLLLAMEYLCQQNGMEAFAVADDAGAQMWLIVSTPSGYRHLLPRDLRPAADPQTPLQLPLHTDEELVALGFQWPAGLHPACVDYSGTMPE